MAFLFCRIFIYDILQRTNDLPQDNHIDLDLERAILAACIYSEDAYNSIAGDIEPIDFALKAHQSIFSAIEGCVKSGEPLALSFIKKHKKIDEAVFSEILSTTSIVDVPKYAAELREKSVKRRLLAFAQTIPTRIGENKEVSQISDEISKEIFAIANRTRQADIKDSKAIIDEVLEEFRRQKETENKGIVGLDTGFDELNQKIKGFKEGDLIIIAARPGMGKTSMALTFIEKTLREGKGVVFFSLEMPAIQIMQRLLSAKTLIPLQRIVTADLNDDEFERVGAACEDYAQKHLYVYDSGYATITDIRLIMRRLCEQDASISMCVVDYIGLMTSSGTFTDRHLQVSEISRGFKLLARELNMPIIALSQLNRSLESRTNKRPMLSDLRESGAIEQDADTILFVYRDEIYLEQEEKEREARAKLENKEYKRKFIAHPKQEKAELIIGKNRNGPTGTVNLLFLKDSVSFEEAPREHFEATNFEG